MLELVRGKPSEVCVGVGVGVCVCVLELAGPVSVHALEPVSYTAALSGCFSLKLPDITANTTYTHMNTHVSLDMTSPSDFNTELKHENHFKNNILVSQFEVCCYR